MITEQQINNIHKLSVDDCLTIALEVLEKAGAVSVEQYYEATLIPTRTIYHMIKTGKIKCFEYAGKKFPLLNK